MNAQCLAGRVDAKLLAQTDVAFTATGIGVDVAHQWLIGVLKRSGTAPCRWLDDATAAAMVAAVRAHPRRDQEVESRLVRAEAYLLLRQGECEQARKRSPTAASVFNDGPKLPSSKSGSSLLTVDRTRACGTCCTIAKAVRSRVNRRTRRY